MLYAVLLIAGYSSWLIWGPAYPVDTDNSGWLRAGNDPVGPISCDDADNPLVARVIYGTSVLTVPISQRLTDVILDNDTRVLAFERRSNLIAIDADLYNADGYLAVHIERNKFRLIDGRYSYSDRPGTNDLKVWGPKKEAMLHVWHINPRTILVSGDFYTKYGNHVTINEGKDVLVTPKSGPRIDAQRDCGIAIKLSRRGLMIGAPQLLHGPDSPSQPQPFQ